MKQREPRQKVMIQARVSAGSSWNDACILNMSSRGMLVQSSTAPPKGSYLEVRRGPHVVVARVVWSDSGRFGVRTQDVVSAAALMSVKPAANHGTEQPAAPAERRTGPRAATKHEISRLKARAFQFGTLIVFAAAAAIIGLSLVKKLLAVPMQALQVALHS